MTRMTEKRVREIAREVSSALIDPMKLWTYWQIIENNVRQKEGVRD